MSFHNVRLPEDIERGAQGGPQFMTNVFTLSSGYEKRNIDWERSRGRWDISYGMDTKANHEEVLAFFYARRGRAYGFRFKDWTDYQVGRTEKQQIAVGNNAQTKFQIVRRYTDGTFTFDRPLTRIVAGTTRVFLDAAEQLAGWSVNADTGIVTFDTAPLAAVSVGIICEFDVPVRFNVDALELSAVRDDAFTLPAIEIVELREELGSLA